VVLFVSLSKCTRTPDVSCWVDTSTLPLAPSTKMVPCARTFRCPCTDATATSPKSKQDDKEQNQQPVHAAMAQANEFQQNRQQCTPPDTPLRAAIVTFLLYLCHEQIAKAEAVSVSRRTSDKLDAALPMQKRTLPQA
jgi:hypothetical protein